MDFILANPLVSALAIGFIIMIMVLAVKSAGSPYVPAKALMTDAELNFYRQLMRIVPPGILVFSKVRIADIVDVKPSLKGKGRVKHFNPIAAKHFDFVLVDDKKMHILGAIELNDSSHQRKERMERDAFVRKVMESAKLPLFEIKATRKYKLDDLRSSLLSLVGREQSEPQPQSPASSVKPIPTKAIEVPASHSEFSMPFHESVVTGQADDASEPDIKPLSSILPEPEEHPLYQDSDLAESKIRPLSSFLPDQDEVKQSETGYGRQLNTALNEQPQYIPAESTMPVAHPQLSDDFKPTILDPVEAQLKYEQSLNQKA
ncbi:MAG: hypothetical protein CML22_07515 [Rheinheimera sp.]|nr:hypothetical protein [Rheinheimera sp.]|tara:strand:+ start:348 stop:1298 length:951 start_codon:yes stop_codon:yes gene_type:complete